MNPLSVSALSASMFLAHLILALFVLKRVSIKLADTSIGQAIAWLVH